MKNVISPRILKLISFTKGFKLYRTNCFLGCIIETDSSFKINKSHPGTEAKYKHFYIYRT